MYRLIGAAALAATVTVLVPVADAQATHEGACTDTSRACVIAAAESYLDSIRTHSGEHLRVAPMVKRTRNYGEQTPEEQWYTGDEMRQSLDHSEDSVVSVHDVLHVVDGATDVVFYAIDASYGEGGAEVAQTWLAERFHVTAGLLDEMEAVFVFTPGVTPTDRGWSTDPADSGAAGTCADSTRTCIADTAATWLDAELSGDYQSARLAPNARRTLEGRTVGVDATTSSVVPAPAGPTTYQARMVRWWVDESTGDAVVFAALDQAIGGQHVATIHTAQRLRVRRGLITEVEQIAWPTQGTTPTPTGWES